MLAEIINKSEEKGKEDIIVLVEEKFERRLSEEIGKVRSELIKWMFIFSAKALTASSPQKAPPHIQYL